MEEQLQKKTSRSENEVITVMDSKYAIVNYNPEFKNQIAGLQKYLWSPSVALNTAYFEWKYERNPYMDTPPIYLALCDGEVVGMRGMFGLKWEVGVPSNSVLGLSSEDFVIAPDHRNRGLMKEIMRAAITDLANRGYSHVFSLSAGPVVMFASLATGWRNVGSMQTLRRPPNHLPFFERSRRFIIEHYRFRRFADKFPFRQWVERQRPLYYLDRKISRRSFQVSPCLSIQQTPRPKAMAELVKQIGNDGRIRHVRDEIYLAWRFQNPLCRYRFLFWEEGGLKGYLVLQEYVSKYMNRTRVNIVDWEATSLNVSAELLRAAVSCCDFADLEIWSATMDSGKKMLLRDAGFKPLETGKGKKRIQFSILVKSLRDDTLDKGWAIANVPLLDMSNWDVRMIFSTMG
jgi:GNAT superfamily N-acetyltransferase